MTTQHSIAMSDDPSTSLPQNVERRKPRVNQYVATLLVSIISFSQGSFMGWTSPVQPLLQSQDTPANFPPIGDEEASWIVSVSSLSSVFAIPLCSYAVDKLGRKRTGYLVAVPFILSWVLTLCADSVGMLYAARCLGGLSAGGAGILVPTYANDVAEDDIRGLLGTIFSVAQNTGYVFSYAVGSYVSYTWFNVCCLVLPVVFLLAFFWLPESPLFLMTKGEEEAAKKALAWLRDGRQAENELLRVKKRAEDLKNKRRNKMQLSGIMNRGTTRALLICIGTMSNMQLTGTATLTSYTVTIFQDSGSSALSANVSTIIVGGILALGTILSSLAIERAGRRLLLIGANLIASVCLFFTGTYFYMKKTGSNVEFISWLPIACLSILILFMGLALIPIPFILTTELPSPQARGFVQSTAIIFLSVAVFVSLKTFTSLSHLIGIYGCFWFYGVSCITCATMIYFTIPETKNRSSEDIVAQLNSQEYILSVIGRKQARDIESVPLKRRQISPS